MSGMYVSGHASASSQTYNMVVSRRDIYTTHILDNTDAHESLTYGSPSSHYAT